MPTNGDTSGVYANQGETSPLITFEAPKVDVPILEIAITAPDKNVYLYDDMIDD